MPRLNVIEPDKATGKAKELFDGPLKDKKLNIFKGMANSPAAVEAYLGMSQALAKGVLGDNEREVIQLAVSQENGCDYCLAAHTAMGKKAGLTDEQATGARKGAIPGDAKLDALAKFAKALHEKKGFVSDDDLKRFRDAGWDDAATAETIANYAQATFSNYFNHVHQSPVDLPEAPALP